MGKSTDYMRRYRKSGVGGKITFQQARQYSKEIKSLNQRIGRLQADIDIVNGKIPYIGITASGRKRLKSAQNNYKRNKENLLQLTSQKEKLEKKLQKYRNQS